MVNRPVGITILAIALMVSGNLFMLNAIILIVSLLLISRPIGIENSIGVAPFDIVLMSWILNATIFSIIYLVLSIGLWKLKNWARLLVLVGASFLLALPSLIFLVQGLYAGMLFLGLGVIIIWYLLQPNVKSAFSE